MSRADNIAKPADGVGLIDAITAHPPSWFAEVDSALIDGLPDLLARHGFTAAPLYLEGAASVATGPYLVDLPSCQRVASLVALLAGAPAAVYWSWPGEFVALRRHLRSLNLTEIPRDEKAAADAPAYRAVVFRHADPNVLAAALPLLTAEQLSRFVGEAAALAFDADRQGGVLPLPRPTGLPAKPRGMIRFSPDQMTGIAGRRVHAAHGRIARYLRRVATEYLTRVNEPELMRRIARFAEEARDFGLVSERDIGRWSFLQTASGGTLADHPGVREALAAPALGETPTRRLDQLFFAVELDLRARV